MTEKPSSRAQASDATTVATRRRMADLERPAALREKAGRLASRRSYFIYAILIANCFGIASLVAALKPEHLSDHAYTLCVAMIDAEIALIVLLMFFISYSDGHLTRPLYEEASSIWENLATRDSLTGLANRLAFMHALDEELVYGRQHQIKCAVLFIDLNRFKQINDTYGHGVGDSVIALSAKRIYQAISPRDVAARLGGDEFAVLLRNVTIGHVQKIVDEIDRAMRAPMEVDDKTLAISASIGVRISDEKSRRAEEVLHDADVRMYKAKAAARFQRTDTSRLASNPQFNREPKRT